MKDDYAKNNMESDSVKLSMKIDGNQLRNSVYNEAVEKYKNISEQLPQSIFEANKEGIVTWANEKALEMFGYSKTELENKFLITLLVAESDRKKAFFHFYRILKSGKNYKNEFNAIKKDGTVFPVIVYGSPVIENGKIIGGRGIIIDSTEQKQSEQALKESELRYSLLLDLAPDAFFQGDKNGNFTIINKKALEITGYTKEELLKMNIKDLFSEEVISKNPLRYDLLDLGETIRIEREIKKKDGSKLPVEMNSKKMPDGTYQSFFRDISERKNAEEKKQKRYIQIQRQQQAILKLSKNELFTYGSVELFSKLLTSTVANIFNAERISVWYFGPNNKEFICIDLFEKSKKLHTSGAVLSVKDFPIYFNSLKTQLVIDADDALKDERTIEFLDNYLKPNDIKSMLDSAIIISGKILGVVCVEHIKNTHNWSDNEIYFVNQLAELCGSVSMNMERKKHLEEIEKLNRVYAFISQINQMVVRTPNRKIILSEACRIAIEYGKFRMAWIGLIDKETNVIKPHTWYGIENGYLSKLEEIYKNSEAQDCSARIAVSKEQIVVDNNFGESQELTGWQIEAVKRGYRSVISLPIKVNKTIIGVFTIYADKSHFFDNEEIKLFEEVTGDISFALETKILAENKDLAEKQLMESENRYRNFFEKDISGIFLSTLEGNLLDCNPAFAFMLGYDSIEEIKKQNASSFYLSTTDRTQFLEKLKKEKMVSGIELTLKRKDGSEITVVENVVGIFNETGSLVKFQGYMNDITKRKNSENELKKLSQAVKQSPVSIIITDISGNIEYVNPKFLQVTGYTLREVIGQNPRFLKSGLTPDEVYKNLWTTITSGKDWNGELLNKKKNGELFWELASISGVKQSDGTVKNFIAIKEDITERKQDENKILTLAHAIESISECVSITDLKDNIIFVNESFCNTYGYSQDELIGKNIVIVRSNKYDNSPDAKYIPKTSDGGWSDELINKRKDGSEFPVRVSTAIVKDNKNNPIAFIGVAVDITKEKQNREELISAKEEAEKSNKLKSEFLAQMSHEIRSPIHTILSFTNLLKSETENYLKDELKSSFGTIDIASKRIIRTIDSILNMSELQTGTYQTHEREIDLKEDVLNKIFDEYKFTAKEKKLELILSLNTEFTKIIADEYSVNQLLINLIDNAIKYTSKGKIEVTVERDDQFNLVVKVEDSGIGISKEYLPNLFEPFTQEEQGYTRRYEGNGLGLALVKKYCDLNNADIKVKSTKDIGTIFTITFLNS